MKKRRLSWEYGPWDWEGRWKWRETRVQVTEGLNGETYVFRWPADSGSADLGPREPGVQSALPAKLQQVHHFYSHLLSSHIGMSKLTHLLAAETGIQATWGPTELRCKDKVCCSALWKADITWMTLIETHTLKNENLRVFMKKQRGWKPRNSMSCLSLL